MVEQKIKIILDKQGVEEFFKQYATESTKKLIRATVKEELQNVVKDELKRKIDSFSRENIETIIRDILKKDIFKNHWLHEKDYPTQQMADIVLEEFQKKVNNVNFKEVEKYLMQEARKVLDEKMNAYKNIIKLIDKAK